MYHTNDKYIEFLLSYLCVSKIVVVVCLFFILKSQSRIFHSYGDIIIICESLQRLSTFSHLAGKDLDSTIPAVIRGLSFLLQKNITPI